jgi:predicted NUDIX family NTP pyrophosphohydrolase
MNPHLQPPRSRQARTSAGLLMYRERENSFEVFLVHPGGPFFAKKDRGVWSIPKGEPGDNENLLPTACREFEEETGITPQGEFLSLGTITQRGGKTVHAWTFQGDWDDLTPIRSNTFRMEWPPHSGTIKEFPEVDRAAFFEPETAKEMINPAQVPLIERLQALLQGRSCTQGEPRQKQRGSCRDHFSHA